MDERRDEDDDDQNKEDDSVDQDSEGDRDGVMRIREGDMATSRM